MDLSASGGVWGRQLVSSSRAPCPPFPAPATWRGRLGSSLSHLSFCLGDPHPPQKHLCISKPQLVGINRSHNNATSKPRVGTFPELAMLICFLLSSRLAPAIPKVRSASSRSRSSAESIFQTSRGHEIQATLLTQEHCSRLCMQRALGCLTSRDAVLKKPEGCGKFLQQLASICEDSAGIRTYLQNCLSTSSTGSPVATDFTVVQSTYDCRWLRATSC